MMAFEGSRESKKVEFKMSSMHKRSKSFPGKEGVEEDSLNVPGEASPRIKLKLFFMQPDMGDVADSAKPTMKLSPNMKVHNSLKQEIFQLEKRLQDQLVERCALEAALGFRSSSSGDESEISMSKPATELIKEIAVLELEVVHLEQYLLSLYRMAFDQQVPSVSSSFKDNRVLTKLDSPRGSVLATPRCIVLKAENFAAQPVSELIENNWKDSDGRDKNEKLFDPDVNRCQSSITQLSGFSRETSPPVASMDASIHACHSQPLSLTECASNPAPKVISLAEHLGARISDHVPETANKISEDMIKCMSAIYCKLAEAPETRNGLSSPNSSLSSLSGFSPRDHLDMWSPGFRNNSSFEQRLDNPFQVEGLKEFSGPYSNMVEVTCLYKDSQKLADIEDLLQDFRVLICRLEEIDPRKLKHEEKLAFWINIHNALVMHAFLAYGIPRSNLKRTLLLLKAAYNVGGHTISAGTIQSSILRCRMPRPGQWLRLLFSSRTKFKTGDERQAYTIEHPESLLHFALCCGNHSDPAVRIYIPKKVFQEMETAKEEYIRATFGVHKGHKILLPKIVESFIKESGLCQTGKMEMIQQSLPGSLQKSLKKHQLAKGHKSIEWIPHNFSFRYLISKELVK